MPLNTFGVVVQKPNMIFVTSVTFKFKVMTPKSTGPLVGLWGSYIPSSKFVHDLKGPTGRLYTKFLSDSFKIF